MELTKIVVLVVLGKFLQNRVYQHSILRHIGVEEEVVIVVGLVEEVVELVEEAVVIVLKVLDFKVQMVMEEPQYSHQMRKQIAAQAVEQTAQAVPES